MKLIEYQAKELFGKYDMPIPKGYVCKDVDEVKHVLAKLNFPVVIKAQVPVGGRGKAGGVKLAYSMEEALEKAEAILSMEIKGIPVRKILVAEAVDIDREIYVSVVLDRRNDTSTIIASREGGVDIEEVAKRNPEAILRYSIDPLVGLRGYEAREIAFRLHEDRKIALRIADIIFKLYRAYSESESQLAEINPLVVDKDGNVWVVDAKVILDENALSRHPELQNMKDEDYENPQESEAKKYGLSFIKLDGNIGNMVNGAGLAMATMDVIKYFGGEPANFLDVGGSSNPEKTRKAMELIVSDPNVKAVFINIFGGITRTDDIAKGLIEAFKTMEIDVPVVVRLTGTNEELARKMLEESGLPLIVVQSMSEGAKKAVELANS